ncbi:hypothetical protein PIB30_038879 [Stylosanthes scabra]|uniref:Uncharacterized protein n=1 Tax=Stylosanthes scabra TaxID=79078 RepID=A0ABU6XFY8_9FABA|nr:hypothetical protein [Stylosanthes scabra]
MKHHVLSGSGSGSGSGIGTGVGSESASGTGLGVASGANSGVGNRSGSVGGLGAGFGLDHNINGPHMEDTMDQNQGPAEVDVEGGLNNVWVEDYEYNSEGFKTPPEMFRDALKDLFVPEGRDCRISKNKGRSQAREKGLPELRRRRHQRQEPARPTWKVKGRVSDDLERRRHGATADQSKKLSFVLPSPKQWKKKTPQRRRRRNGGRDKSEPRH